MDTGKMLIPLSAAAMKKVTTYHSLFGPDLVCSGITNECIHLIGDRFGYNSEKQFNNPLFLKRHCNEGRWQQWTTTRFLIPVQVEWSQNWLLAAPLFLNQMRHVYEGESFGCFDKGSQKYFEKKNENILGNHCLGFLYGNHDFYSCRHRGESRSRAAPNWKL